MPIRFTVSFVALAFITLLTSQCLADCEGGNYAIHTVADYKGTDTTKIYLLYEMQPDHQLFAHLNAVDKRETMVPKPSSVTVTLGTARCDVPTGWEMDPKYNPEDYYSSSYPYRLQMSTCSLLLPKIPTAGYLLFDSSHSAVTLPAELPLQAEVPLAERLKKQIVADAESRELYLSTIPDWASDGGHARQEGRITRQMIKNYSVKTTAVGQGSQRFKMAVVTLILQDVPENFPKKYIPADMELKPTLTVNYPVIYFILPGKAARYIGDGSTCSYVHLSSQDDNIDFDRFEITKAFDLNHDGLVDILEINGRFAYEINPNGEPSVIHYGGGC